MMIEHKNLCIFFGDASTSISVPDLKGGKLNPAIQQLLTQKQLYIASGEQVHGDVIVDVVESTDFYRTSVADALQTKLFDMGLAVFTADCVPLVLYDHAHHAVAVVHIGWKGALLGIAQKTVRSMQATYGTNVQEVEVFVGPAVRSCCYEIGHDVYDQILQQEVTQAIALRNGKIYFDVTLFVIERLVNLGISAANIYTNNNVCTVCNPNYCSYRKDKEQAHRQITLAWQKDLR